MCNNNENNNSCIAEVLAVIALLQQNASCCGDSCLDTCDRGFLGCGVTNLGCNTRPIILYTCSGNGTPFSVPTTKTDGTCDDGTTVCSSVFRVEKIDGNCATFRVLQPNTDPTSGYPYEATNSFFTMNLNCLCAIRCLNDTYIECI